MPYVQVIQSIRSRFAPFFTIAHATRGQLPGPYSKLPADSTGSLRRLALDVAGTLLASSSEDGDDVFESAVDRAVSGTAEDAYWAGLKSTLLSQ